MGVWSQEMQWYQRVSSNFRGVISSNSGWIDAFLLFILIKKEGKKNNQQCLDHSQNPDLYGAGLPTHDKERSPVPVGALGKSAGGKVQNRTRTAGCTGN